MALRDFIERLNQKEEAKSRDEATAKDTISEQREKSDKEKANASRVYREKLSTELPGILKTIESKFEVINSTDIIDTDKGAKIGTIIIRPKFDHEYNAFELATEYLRETEKRFPVILVSVSIEKNKNKFRSRQIFEDSLESFDKYNFSFEERIEEILKDLYE